DLLLLEDPAHLRHARLDDVGRARIEDGPERDRGRLVLAARDRRAERRAHARETIIVLGRPHRLLEPAQLVALELAARATRGPHAPRAVGVEHQLDAVAGHLARVGHRPDVGLVELYGGEAEDERRRDGLAHLGGRLVAEEARVDARAGGAEPAEELIDGHAARLARE